MKEDSESDDIKKAKYPYLMCPSCFNPAYLVTMDEKINILTLKCLNSNCDKEISIGIKKYLEKIENKKGIHFKDECPSHPKNEFYSFCFDSYKHLCKICHEDEDNREYAKGEIEIDSKLMGCFEKIIKNYKALNPMISSIKKIKLQEKEEIKKEKESFFKDIEAKYKEFQEYVANRKLKYIQNSKNISKKFKYLREKMVIFYDKNKTEIRMNNHLFEKIKNRYKSIVL